MKSVAKTHRAPASKRSARIAEYREAVKEAAEGAFIASFDRLDQLGAVSECPPDAARDALASACVDLAVKKDRPSWCRRLGRKSTS